jgi:two-component system chemotaxis response regulator CheB
MPSSALRQVAVDYVLAASDIPRLIVQLTRDPQAQDGFQPMASDNDPETALPNEQTPVRKMEQLFGAPSALTCPDCGGSLWEVEDGRLIRYRCHVGHQYAPDSLAAEQRDVVEAALWRAVRVLEEHAALRLRMARRADAAGLSVVSEGFAEGARSSHRQAQEIRARLFGGGGEAPQSLEDEAAKPAVEKGTRKAKRKAR